MEHIHPQFVLSSFVQCDNTVQEHDHLHSQYCAIKEKQEVPIEFSRSVMLYHPFHSFRENSPRITST